MTRNEVAKVIGVTPATIYRWEKRGISPANPKRHLRTKQLIYSDDDRAKLQAFKDETAPAVIGRAA